MKFAIPTEVKNNEFRVALTPSGARELTSRGHEVVIQAGAGAGSRFSDDEYAAQGAVIVADADEVWGSADIVLKVKEPVASEFHRLREDLALFTYLHLAADRPLIDALLAAGTTTIAYETVTRADGSLPLLYPMSEIAGCLAPMVGSHSLMRAGGGRGVIMGGVGGVPGAKVVILGGGVAGQNAANIALGMGADVTVLDTDLDKLRRMYWRFGGRVRQLMSTSLSVADEVTRADLVIGAVLVPGALTPRLVSNELVAAMQPGSVLVDIAIDQGGCFADSHPTTHDDPTFAVHNSLFYCVANMPGAVPHTSTMALTNATLPYVVQLAQRGWQGALSADPGFAAGLNTHGGQLTNAAVAEATGLAAITPEQVLAQR